MGADASKIFGELDKKSTGTIEFKFAIDVAANLPKKMAAHADEFLAKVKKGEGIETEALRKFFEGKKIDTRKVLAAAKKAKAPKEATLAFTSEEVKKSIEIDGMAKRPSGKPTPEEAEALKKQKTAKAAFFETVRSRLGLNKKSWSDKKIAKALLAFQKNANDEEKKRKGISLEPPSGTRDFFPEDYAVQSWLFEEMKKVGRAFGFQEYDAPVLEHAELYKRKAGEEITQQMYNFVDKEGAEVTLRPEMTPTLARMVLKKMDDSGEIRDLLPLKWFSIPQCWRFETTQRGRKREHYQWNMDIVGVEGVTAELELLAAVTTFFKNLGITAKDVGIKVNSRKVLGAIVSAAGVSKEMFAPVCVIIDKLDKIGPEAVTQELADKKVPKESADMILKAMECKTIHALAKLCEGKVDTGAIDEMKNLFKYAEDYGFGDFMIFDASVVRGLAYYTGIVFECFDRRGELRAICGGGRYDRLLSLYGSVKEIPCVGFGFGDCVIMELLKELKLLPEVKEKVRRRVDFVVAPFNQDLFGAACSVANKLRMGGFSVDMLQTPMKKVRKAFSYADKAGARRIVLVAPDEWNKDSVRVKDLRNVNDDEDKGDVIPIVQLVELMKKAMSA
eukprot:CAMPEP_0114506614 /NCGR_PEP_ID=MMETSP0109-20121206/11521_1 /TAXON_ID=29199 /ORGANISM="Chlorarachnion reptans, Strain CCCM449" /LENGTH=616 /DNA_ID=CAMNT_0001685213 /DNA_START=125 /DNA_END=1975 /DNA_ORIENTATION=+